MPDTGTAPWPVRKSRGQAREEHPAPGSKGGEATAGLAGDTPGCAGCKSSPVFPLCAKAPGYITAHVVQASTGALTIL